MSFRVEDDPTKIQRFRRGKYQIQIFQCLGKKETFHLIRLNFCRYIAEHGVGNIRPAKFYNVDKIRICHSPVFVISGKPIKIICGLNNFRAQVILLGGDLHRGIIELFRFDMIQGPHS